MFRHRPKQLGSADNQRHEALAWIDLERQANSILKDVVRAQEKALTELLKALLASVTDPAKRRQLQTATDNYTKFWAECELHKLEMLSYRGRARASQ